MAANGSKDEVEWDLDWDDLTGGATPPASRTPPSPATASPAAPHAAGIPPLPSQPPPRRAFPTPATTFPDAEPQPIVAPQRLPTASPVATPAPTAAPTPPPLPTFAPAPASPPPPTTTHPARTLVRGQRLRLAEVFPGDPSPAFTASLTLAAPFGVTLDLCCFGLDEAGKLSDDRYFIFYNQKSSPEGALSLRDDQGNVFSVNLGQLPPSIRRLVFTATVDGAGTVQTLGPSRLELRDASGQAVARYDFTGGDLEEVKALMVAEIYHKDAWRLAAVGQGFAGGLSDLLRHFGGQEA